MPAMWPPTGPSNRIVSSNWIFQQPRRHWSSATRTCPIPRRPSSVTTVVCIRSWVSCRPIANATMAPLLRFAWLASRTSPKTRSSRRYRVVLPPHRQVQPIAILCITLRCAWWRRSSRVKYIYRGLAGMVVIHCTLHKWLANVGNHAMKSVK